MSQDNVGLMVAIEVLAEAVAWWQYYHSDHDEISKAWQLVMQCDEAKAAVERARKRIFAPSLPPAKGASC